MTAKEYLQNTASQLTATDIDGVTTTLHFDFGDGAGVHSIFAKNLENVLLHMSPVFDDVVLVEKREETETVSAEEPKSVTQLINLIEIQPEVKHPVTEPMHTGHQPMMQHRAFIKG
jgi:hypothetical protein